MLQSLSRSVLFLIARETCPEAARQEILELSQQKQIGSFAAAAQIVRRHQTAAKQGVPVIRATEQREVHRGPLAGQTVTVLARDEITVTVEVNGETTELLCSDFVPMEEPPQSIIPPGASLAIASMRGEYLAARVEALEQAIADLYQAWQKGGDLSAAMMAAARLAGIPEGAS